MLQNIRDNSQGIIAKVIVGFIIITFALFGIESIVALGNSESVPATVNGSDIEEIEILRLVEIQKNRFRQQFGENYDEDLFNEGFLRQSAIEQLIEQKISVTQAKSLGGYVSEQSIDKAILTTPEFQQDGKFSSDLFKMVLRRSGLTPLSYRTVLREQSLVSQVQLGTGLTDTILPFELQRQVALKNEQRAYDYFVFEAADLRDGIELSEEEIESFYQSQKQSYMTEEKVSVDYVVLNKSDLKSDIHVDDEEIDLAYQDYLDQANSIEERKVSHILIEANDDRDDAEASVLAEEVYEKASNGASFADLAMQYSDDIGSKNLGGDLGFNTRGSFDSEFDDVLFAMDENAISEPIKTDFGYHIIKLDEIRKPVIESKEDKAADLIAEIQSSQLNELFAEQTEMLAAAAFENDSIENLVAHTDLGLKAENSGLFSRTFGNGIADHSNIRTNAFDEKIINDRELSDVLEISADQVVVIGLSQHVAPIIKPLVEVEGLIKNHLLTQKSNALATEKANQLIANMDTDSVQWKHVKDATFNRALGVPAELNRAVFSLPKEAGEVVSVKVSNGQALAVLKGVSDVEVEATEADMAAISQEKANESFYVYREWAKNNSEVERSGS